MSREEAYMRILKGSAELQWNMEKILAAKALEAEKVRNWVNHHVKPDAFSSQQHLVKDTMQIHDQLIEAIDGITKLGQGMSSILKAALRHDADNGGDMLNGMFGGFGMESGDNQ